MAPTRGIAPTIRDVFAIAWPLTLKAIMLHGIVVIDAYLVAPLGEEALASMGLATAVAGFVLGLLLAFANATQIRVAQAFGTGEANFLKSALISGLIVSVVVGCLGVALIWTSGEALLAALGHEGEIAQNAQRYLSVFTIVILSESIGQNLSSYFNGSGNTKLPLLSYVLTLPINVAISFVLIHGHLGLPAFGVVGAAIGSAIATAIQAAFLFACLLKAEQRILRSIGWRNGTFPTTLWRHLTFALPIAATFGSATVAMHVCSLIYANLEVNAFAAMTLIFPWVMVAGTIGMCWAQAAGIIVAHLLGQERPPRVLDAFLGQAWRAAFFAAGFVSVFYVVVCILAPWIYPGLNPETLSILRSFWPLLLILPFPKQSNAMCGNALRAGGETVYVMHVFVWSQWLFRVPATAILVLVLDAPAFWVFSVQLLEEFIKFPAFHLRLYKGDWKKGKLLA